jgi:DEAD_2
MQADTLFMTVGDEEKKVLKHCHQEDIVKLGKKVRACPYYGTRELKNKSQVGFGFSLSNFADVLDDLMFC